MLKGGLKRVAVTAIPSRGRAGPSWFDDLSCGVIRVFLILAKGEAGWGGLDQHRLVSMSPVVHVSRQGGPGGLSVLHAHSVHCVCSPGAPQGRHNEGDIHACPYTHTHTPP